MLCKTYITPATFDEALLVLAEHAGDPGRCLCQRGARPVFPYQLFRINRLVTAALPAPAMEHALAVPQEVQRDRLDCWELVDHLQIGAQRRLGGNADWRWRIR